MKLKQVVATSLLAASLSFGVAQLAPQPAYSTVPPDVQTGVDNSIATVGALSTLALAALSVALVPLGAMLTLRFLNMVLSRV